MYARVQTGEVHENQQRAEGAREATTEKANLHEIKVMSLYFNYGHCHTRFFPPVFVPLFPIPPPLSLLSLIMLIDVFVSNLLWIYRRTCDVRTFVG